MPEIAGQTHEARISWRRDDAVFTDQQYSRAHEWIFDGGARVPASASPGNVPVSCSNPEAVDPEEALVAATSSCHMLWFLSIAARLGFVVDSYHDEARGVIEEGPAGRRAFSRIMLHPKVEFAGSQRPAPADLRAMHQEAHQRCFIANSLRCDVLVVPV